jgi:hypothetical protein
MRESHDPEVSCGNVTLLSQKGAGLEASIPEEEGTDRGRGESREGIGPSGGSLRRKRSAQSGNGVRRNPATELARELAARWRVESKIAFNAVTAAAREAGGLERIRELVGTLQPSAPPRDPVALLIALAREDRERRVERERMVAALQLVGVPDSLQEALVSFLRAHGLGSGAARTCGEELAGLLDQGVDEETVKQILQAVPAELRSWTAWREAAGEIRKKMESGRSFEQVPPW